MEIAKEMSAAAGTILQTQRELMAAAQREAVATTAWSRWNAIVLLLCSVAVGGVVLLMLGGVSRRTGRIAVSTGIVSDSTLT